MLRAFACPLRLVRLLRLTPGSVIREHQDYDLSFEEGLARFHIPITTNDEVDFILSCAGDRSSCAPPVADDDSFVRAERKKRYRLIR